ncbi:MAG: hypothetical protein LDL33_11270 [Desulfomonile sp.]|nr:hypothetical protein [Desulfomonile sp.]
MYFWDTRALADEMSRNVLPQREKMKYLLAWTLFNTLAVQNALWTVETITLFTGIKALLVIAVNVVGVLACYAANRRGDDTDFVERFICLGWPVIFKITVVIFIVSALFVAFRVILDLPAIPYLETWGRGSSLLVFLLTIGGEVIYYLWLMSLIARVSSVRIGE